MLKRDSAIIDGNLCLTMCVDRKKTLMLSTQKLKLIYSIFIKVDDKIIWCEICV